MMLQLAVCVVHTSGSRTEAVSFLQSLRKATSTACQKVQTAFLPFVAQCVRTALWLLLLVVSAVATMYQDMRQRNVTSA